MSSGWSGSDPALSRRARTGHCGGPDGASGSAPGGTGDLPRARAAALRDLLGVPFAKIGKAFRDCRFLSTALVVNFVLVPIVVFFLSRIVAHDEVLLIGVLFVLLTPCVDYVIAFTGIAGGAKERLLAASPLLMLAQMLLLPLYLWLFVRAEFIEAVDLAPFVEAFLLLSVLPLVAAGLTQLAATRTPWGAIMQEVVLGRWCH